MNQVDLVALLDEAAVEVVRPRPDRKGWIPCLCPFAEWRHEKGRDTHPSFFVKVNPSGLSTFHCFTCKVKGRVSKMMRLLEHYREEDMSDLVIRADMNDMALSLGDFEEDQIIAPQREELDLDVFANMYPLAWESRACREYLKRRGVTEEASLTMGLLYDDREKRVLFPVKGRDQKLYGFSGRTILPPEQYPFARYSSHRDYSFRKELCLLGEHLFQPGKPMLVVEGLFAFAHMVSLGVREFCNPVATMTARVSDGQRDLFIDLNEAVFLCYDNDHAGDEGLFGDWTPEAGTFQGGGAVDQLRKELPTYLCLYPEGVDDPDKLTLDQVKTMLTRDHEICY